MSKFGKIRQENNKHMLNFARKTIACASYFQPSRRRVRNAVRGVVEGGRLSVDAFQQLVHAPAGRSLCRTRPGIRGDQNRTMHTVDYIHMRTCLAQFQETSHGVLQISL